MIFEIGGIRLANLLPLLDGTVPEFIDAIPSTNGMVWRLNDGAFIEARIWQDARHHIEMRLSGFAGTRRIASLGLRIGDVSNVRQYLRNGYMSWDGSYFVEPQAAGEVLVADPKIAVGHAMTALLPVDGVGALVVGFTRHDRYQSRLEMPPRLPHRRLTGWCSWYNLYASLDEPILLEHLDAARRFRDEKRAPFDIFLVDDGFTPEMGDWLDVKPQFPRGIRPVIDAAAGAGFTPGLWIAPFMVGNRSRLYAAHPDWVVKSRATGRPLAPMTFYGEFRWHKRSEEYYILDVTHPDAEAYIRGVFRTWAKQWGVGYFKTDFMHLGSTYGPDETIWHEDGMSRIAIWMRMARLIREEIGEALWLCCGAPIWAPVGLVDAVRIGRDIGVSWKGHYSAESLLRDQSARNFGNGILWQADPDCILLRDRFHDLTETQVLSLAMFAGLAGGIAMTSDQLDEVPQARRDLLATLLGDGQPYQCDFPELGRTSLGYRLGTAPNGQPMAISEGNPVLIQRIRRTDGSVLLNVFNSGDAAVERQLDLSLIGIAPRQVTESGVALALSTNSMVVALGPHQSRQLVFTP